jgi:hypothetical protein
MATDIISDLSILAEDAPVKIYCLKCRKQVDIVPGSLACKLTISKSKKKLIEVKRPTWVAICSECGKRVRKFAKSKKPASPKL